LTGGVEREIDSWPSAMGNFCRSRTSVSLLAVENTSIGPAHTKESLASSCSGGTRDFGSRRKGSLASGAPFPKRPLRCKLSSQVWKRLEELFQKMDPDGSNAVTREEARMFFKGAFGKLSADAMFDEVDMDNSGAITAEEFVQFWIQVRKSGYKDQELIDELDELLDGAAWVDWKESKQAPKAIGFPRRPMLCRLSAPCWQKCEELFRILDCDGTMVINREKAEKHFVGAFAKVSVDAMFNELDPNNHGQINAKEWMKFWLQVRSSGYKEKDMMEELENLKEGSTWVDWKDGRSTE